MFTPPPRQLTNIPSVLTKAKVTYSLWFKTLADFPKIYRYALGGKIENYFLDLLELIITSLYLPPDQKYRQLTVAITKLDAVKFFLELAWENKCLVDVKYTALSEALNEIGRMLGGWKKGLENKTPPK